MEITWHEFWNVLWGDWQGFWFVIGVLLILFGIVVWINQRKFGRRSDLNLARGIFIGGIVLVIGTNWYTLERLNSIIDWRREEYQKKLTAEEDEAETVRRAQIAKEIEESKPENQLRKITDMQAGLRRQIENISKAQSVYQSDIEKYSNEIKKEKEAKHITSYAQASERMKYNIQLIREVDAYNTEMAKIRQVTENGLEEAIYTERRLNAKFIMAKTIGDGKVLSQEVDGLLKKYGPLMDQYVIDPKKLTVKSPEEIWEQIGR
ncbi:MAG: hypothetical protein WC823_03780 [Parcubacteria group bacterium]